MKCPRCKFVPSNKKDVCPHCQLDLRPHKAGLGLPITHPTASLAELIAQLAEENSSAGKTEPHTPKKHEKIGEKENAAPVIAVASVEDAAAKGSWLKKFLNTHPTPKSGTNSPAEVAKTPVVEEIGEPFQNSAPEIKVAQVETPFLSQAVSADTASPVEQPGEPLAPASTITTTALPTPSPAIGASLSPNFSEDLDQSLDEIISRSGLEDLFEQIESLGSSLDPQDSGIQEPILPEAPPVSPPQPKFVMPLKSPHVSPTVFEFAGDDDAALDDELNEYIGDTIVQVQSVKSERIIPPKGQAKFLLDDDVEVTFEVEIKDDQSPTVEIQGTQASFGSSMAVAPSAPPTDFTQGFMDAFEQLNATDTEISLAENDDSSVLDEKTFSTSDILFPTGGRGVSAEGILALVQAQIRSIPVSEQERVVKDLLSLLSHTHNETDTLRALEAELANELDGLMTEGTTFLGSADLVEEIAPQIEKSEVEEPEVEEPEVEEASEEIVEFDENAELSLELDALVSERNPFASQAPEISEATAGVFSSAPAALQRPVQMDSLQAEIESFALIVDAMPQTFEQPIVPIDPTLIDDIQTPQQIDAVHASETTESQKVLDAVMLVLENKAAAVEIIAVEEALSQAKFIAAEETILPEPLSIEPVFTEPAVIDSISTEASRPQISIDPELWDEVEQELSSLPTEIELNVFELSSRTKDSTLELLFDLIEEEIIHPEQVHASLSTVLPTSENRVVDTAELDHNFVKIDSLAKKLRRWDQKPFNKADEQEMAVVLPSRAPSWRRCASAVIDAAVSTAMGIFIAGASFIPPDITQKLYHRLPVASDELISYGFLTLLTIFFAWILFTALLVWGRGQTVGQRMFGIVVGDLSARPLTLSRAILFSFSQVTSLLCCGLGSLCLLSAKKASLSELMSASRLYHAEKLLSNN